MLGDLITLPLRVGVRATRLWLRVAEETFAVARHATERLIGPGGSGPPNGSDDEDWSLPSPPRPDLAAARAVTPEAGEEPARGPRPVSPPQPPPPLSGEPDLPLLSGEPTHVSEEPELVEEFAEPGAEEGAGAEVHVDAPWDGYNQMNVKQVIARLGSASTAVLAAVQLYEGSHRGRQTILNAVERELRSANGTGSRS